MYEHFSLVLAFISIFHLAEDIASFSIELNHVLVELE